jgi:ankyrin repeat protein
VVSTYGRIKEQNSVSAARIFCTVSWPRYGHVTDSQRCTQKDCAQVEDARRLLPNASPEDRHRALALSAQFGRTEILRMLLDWGEDPNRYNPPRTHGHSTPLHQAAFAGHEEAVRLLVERGARLDLKDTLWQGTPEG